MRSGAAFGTAALIGSALLGSALLGGCRGDFVYDLGDYTDTDTGDGDGDGDPNTGDNLLGDPSFELWNDQQPVVWGVNGATLTPSDEAFDGDFSGIIDATEYSNIGQYLSFPDPLPAGTCLRGGATIRWLGGSATQPGFLFTAIYVDQMEELHGSMMPWVADGQWHTSQIAQVELPKDTTNIVVSIGNTTPDPHTYGIDAAWLRIEPCE